ncbi:MAG: hypothetical protein V1777_04070 [Candidatus Micrarchaeota archaeon]
MPISIVITLFVVVVVGVLVILFARTQVESAQTSLEGFNPNETEQKNLVFEIDQLSAVQLATGIKECFRRYGQTLQSEMCSVFHISNSSHSFALDATQKTAIYGELRNYPELYNTDSSMGPSGSTVSDAEIDKYTGITVTSSPSTSFFVRWNAEQGKVEVTT